jgi:hypothetical protein
MKKPLEQSFRRPPDRVRVALRLPGIAFSLRRQKFYWILKMRTQILFYQKTAKIEIFFVRVVAFCNRSFHGYASLSDEVVGGYRSNPNKKFLACEWFFASPGPGYDFSDFKPSYDG